KFADQCHGVRSELSTASAGSGTRCGFKGIEPRIRHSATSVHANSFENILDGKGVALELAGSDRASIENKPGNIQTRQGHDAAGNCFVAADQDNQRIKKITARNELNGVGDDFAAYERSAHALRAHRNAIGDGDSVELE